MVMLHVTGRSGAANDQVWLRKDGNSYSYNISGILCPGNGIYDACDAIVFCDSNRVIEYKAIGSWPILVIHVKVWWK